MSAGEHRSKQATVEDYTSDSGDTDGVPLEQHPSRKASPSQGQANVAAKRSSADSKPGAGKVTNIDLQSDSGYSSHTAATIASADSAPSATLQARQPAAPAAVPMPPPTAPTKQRRPTLRDERKTSSQNSPRKAPQRSGSVAARQQQPRERRDTLSQECDDPNCRGCDVKTRRERRPKPSPLDSGLDISYPPFDQRSQRSDPAPSTSYQPHSPAYTRADSYSYVRQDAVLHPAATRMRADSRPRAARPMSYHGGDMMSGAWPGMPVQSSYPSPPDDPAFHAPPPTFSAWQNMQQQQAQYSTPGPYPMVTPSSHFYNSSLPTATHEQMRPTMPDRTSSNYNARMPAPPRRPVITHDPRYSTRYAPNAPQTAGPSQERFPDFDDESSDEGYIDEEYLRGRAIMPPPSIKPARRPTLGERPKTIQGPTRDTDRRMSVSRSLERPSERTRNTVPPRVTTADTTRTKRSLRPALVQHPQAHSNIETAHDARIMVASSKPRRRESQQGYYDKLYDRQLYDEEPRRSQTYDNRDLYRRERRSSRAHQTESGLIPSRRLSKVYRDHESAPRQSHLADSEDDEPRSRRQQADNAHRGRRDSKIKSTIADIDAYQQQVRGSKAPLTDGNYRAAKLAGEPPSGPSSSGSSRSGRGTRVSNSNQTTFTNGGEIRLRVDAKAPVSVQFNGDMDGRTLHIQPGKDGMADIVIEDAPGNEQEPRGQSQRGSTKGSTLGGRRTLAAPSQTKRDAENESVRTSRSSQSRHERDIGQRSLRRRDAREDRSSTYRY